MLLLVSHSLPIAGTTSARFVDRRPLATAEKRNQEQSGAALKMRDHRTSDRNKLQAFECESVPSRKFCAAATDNWRPEQAIEQMTNCIRWAKAFRGMNAVDLKSKFAQIEEENAWDELFYRINLRSDVQEKELGLSFDAATSFENVEKNRYRNVLPYDQNRVELKRFDQLKFSSYINASPLKFPLAERGYILSQGPLPNTADDFWQMVHEQGADIIIMLSKIIEKNFIKCHTYFPSKDCPTERYEFTECELLAEEVKPHYIFRQIRVTLHDSPIKKSSKLEDAAYSLAERIGLKSTPADGAEKKETVNEVIAGKSRVIHHFQYTTWPDFGVPEHTDHFLEFLQHIRDLEKTLKDKRSSVDLSSSKQKDDDNSADSSQFESNNAGATQPTSAESTNTAESLTAPKAAVTEKKKPRSGMPPLVCHCSAGIGRTGAFVMIDTILSILERSSAAAGVQPSKSPKPPPLAAAEDLESSAEDRPQSGQTLELNVANSLEGFTTSADTHKADTTEVELTKSVQNMNEAPIESADKPTLAPLPVASKNNEPEPEEELSAASKKKMRSESTCQRQRACGKISMPKMVPTKANGKPTKTMSRTLLNVEDSDNDEAVNAAAAAELSTLCDVVVFMRKYRMGLIQTSQQLRFCWKAIVDWIDANPDKIGKK